MAFVTAKRAQSNVRLALTGPTNSGKTYSALRMGAGIAEAGLILEGVKEPSQEQVFKKIAVIDTERKRSLFYADRDDLPMTTGEFYFMSLDAPYTAEKYIQAVEEGAKLVGEHGVVIVDSLSHAWDKEGGILDQKDRIEKQKSKNSYTAWADAGRIQNKLIDRILSAKSHVIVTMRSKMKYELEQNEKGKNVPKQLGLAPIQRDDTEYEFDVTLMMDKENHNAMIVKDTTFLSQTADENGYIGVPDELLGSRLFKWLNEGVDSKEILEEERLAKIQEIKKMAKENSDLKQLYKAQLHPETKAADLDLGQARDVLTQFYKYIQKGDA